MHVVRNLFKLLVIGRLGLFTCVLGTTLSGNAAAQVLVSDTLTDSNGTLLTAHTPNLAPGGAAWIELGGWTPVIQSNEIASSVTTGPYSALAIESGRADATVAVDVIPSPDLSFGGLVLRATSGLNFHAVWFRNNAVRAMRVQSGSWTDVNTVSVSAVTPGSHHRLEARLNGSLIKVFWDGTLLFQFSHSFQQSATRHGVLLYPDADALTRLDNFEVQVPNEVPVISGPSNQSHPTGSAVSVQIAATDPDNTPLTYAVTSGLPDGLTVNSSTGLISGTLAASVGTYSVATSVTDGVATSTRTFTWFVTTTGSLGNIVSDTFTGTNGTLLTAHAPDIAPVGASWEVLSGSSIPSIATGAMTLNATSGPYVVTAINGGRADGTISVDVIPASADSSFGGLVLRASSAQSFLAVTFRTTALRLWQVHLGVWTELAIRYPGSVAANSAHRLEARLNGSLIQIYWDHEFQYQFSTSFLQTQSLHGMLWYPDADAATRLDNFQISVPGPSIADPDDRLQLEGTSTSLQLIGASPDGLPLTYSATNLPSGISLNTSTGVLSGTLATGSGRVYSVDVFVSDGFTTVSQTFEWCVVTPDTTVVYNRFNTPQVEYLPNHVFDIAPPGLTWRWLTGLHIPTLVNGHVRTDGSPRSEAWTTDVGIADVSLSVDVRSTDSTPYGGLVLRATDANNYLLLRYQGPRLYRRVNGDYQEIAVSNQAFNAGETHRLTVRAIGSQIDVYSDGVSVFSVNEAFNLTASKHGLLWDPIEDPTLTFDNFEMRSDQEIVSIPNEPCETSVSPSAMTVNSENNTHYINVWAAPGCQWTFDSDADFIDVSRNSPDVVTFTIQNNTQTSSRTGLLDVAGHTVEITQLGAPLPAPPSGSSCATVWPTTLILDSAGGNAEVHISGPSECAWSATSQSAFVQPITPLNGSGAGTASFAFSPNSGFEPRSGSVTVAGLTVVVIQYPANGCDLNVTASIVGSDVGSFGVTVADWCDWTATFDAPWMSLSATSGSGDATVAYNLDRNALPEPHSSPMFLGDLLGFVLGCFKPPAPCIDGRCSEVSFCAFPRPAQTPSAAAPFLVITQGRNPVVRGETLTVGIIGAVGATVSNWQFTGDLVQTINRSVNTAAVSWGGRIVTSGTISVRIAKNGVVYDRSMKIEVQPRDFTVGAAQPQEVVNGATLCDGQPWAVPVPATSSNDPLGLSCLYIFVDFAPALINDNGPNNDVWYVTDVSADSVDYRWIINPDLKDETCQFYLQQTGSYDPVTAPAGLISGANAKANTIRHESGPIASHYAQYVTANYDATRNPGAVAERQLRRGGDNAAFRTVVQTNLSAGIRSILTAMAPEPPQVNFNAGGIFQGFVNYAPYVTCHP